MTTSKRQVDLIQPLRAIFARMAARHDDNDDSPGFNVELCANMALALMWLNVHGDKYGTRAWKGIPWELLDNLFERGLISDPRSKAKSVALSQEAEALAKAMFDKHFGR